jgi:hypothetical protein
MLSLINPEDLVWTRHTKLLRCCKRHFQHDGLRLKGNKSVANANART